MGKYFSFLIGFGIGTIALLWIFMPPSMRPMTFLEHLYDDNFNSNRVLTNDGFQYVIGSGELNALAAHLFPVGGRYYYNYTAYDSYSVRDIGLSKPSAYWEKFSLDTLDQYPDARSQSGLAFVTSIMVITGKHLHARHHYMEKVFLRQGIPPSSIEYRWKWNKQNCADPSNIKYFKSKFPYNKGDSTKDAACANTIEHIDAWYSIAERNLSFALILEDDVAFVPFLKEKFNRFMAEAVKLQMIKVGAQKNKCATFDDSKNMTMDQLFKNPVLTEGIINFGSCNENDPAHKNRTSLLDVPRFVPYRKYHHGRCAHMYGMTHCAAKMVIKTLQKSATRYQWSDWLLGYVVMNSPNLIAWWPYPPLGYQAARTEVIGDLDLLLKQRTYDPKRKATAP